MGRLWIANNSGRDQDVVSEDDLPTFEELLRLTLRKEVLIGEPKKAEHALQRADQQAWPRLVDVGHSQGRDGEGGPKKLSCLRLIDPALIGYSKVV